MTDAACILHSSDQVGRHGEPDCLLLIILSSKVKKGEDMQNEAVDVGKSEGALANTMISTNSTKAQEAMSKFQVERVCGHCTR